MTTKIVNEIKTYLKQFCKDGIAVAFSGGIDSALLLFILREIQKESDFKLKAYYFNSIFQLKSELEDVKKLTAKWNINLKIITVNPLEIKQVKNNCIDRCYWCKKRLFSMLIEEAKKDNLKNIFDGTNKDDTKVYRPGRKALEELKIISPFAILGVTKQQIRELAQDFRIEIASKPSTPCLATRFEYNTLLDDEKIKKVSKGEDFIKLNFPEIKDVRVRVHNNLARIEISKDYMLNLVANYEIIVKKFRDFGFDYVTLDLEGFRSGSFDLHKNL